MTSIILEVGYAYLTYSIDLQIFKFSSDLIIGRPMSYIMLLRF